MIGQNLRQFRLEEKIGSGAMGVVYRAVDERNGRRAAVKVITADPTGRSRSPERFIREAEILQQFRHPNIVRFLGGGRYQGTLYIAMEYIPGGTLEDLLQRQEYLPWREMVDVSIQICDALQYAHERNVIHRDLKPSNLLLTPDGKVKLTDFGIAKDLDATALTADGRTLGTAAYMAPEQIRGNPPVSHRTDLYALGCVMYQMLTGAPPFDGKNAIALMHKHLSENPGRPSAKNPQIPLVLDNLIVALMAKEPTERPLDALAVGHILTELRNKAAQGKPIQMVFSGTGQPTRLSGSLVDSAIDGATGSTRLRKSEKGRAGKSEPPLWERPWFGTTALGAVFLVVLAVILYQFMPASSEYLYKHAAALMAKNERAAWVRAKQDYIDELHTKFPSYRREEVEGWLDRIALNKAEGRAYVLEHPNVLASSKPSGDAEQAFVDTYKATEAMKDLGLLADAARKWREMAGVLRDKPELRGWVLLAETRAATVDKDLQSRRKAAEDRLDLAEKAEKAGASDDAARLRREILKDFGKFHDLKDILDRARPKGPAPKESSGKSR
jgi:serine/threonine-protein kinase